MHIFCGGQDPTSVTEADTQQAFVDILDNDVIKPLRTLKVNHEHLVRDDISVLIIRRSERNLKIRQESGLKEISRNPPRSMQIMLRVKFRSSMHTRRKITLGNILILPRYRHVLRTVRTKGLVRRSRPYFAGGGMPSLPSLKKVPPMSPMSLDFTTGLTLWISFRRRMQERRAQTKHLSIDEGGESGGWI